MLQCITLSSLVKVFPDEQPQNLSFKGFSMLRGEYSAFQTALMSDEDITLDVSVSSRMSVTVFNVENIYGGKVVGDGDNDDYYLRTESGLYPDLLRPACDKAILKAGQWHSVWFEINSFGCTAGKHTVTVKFTVDKKVVSSAKITVEVINAELPEQKLICTHWFHTDCISTYYKLPVFSEEYWQTVERFVKCAVNHGINFLLTPLFTPPLDTAVCCERPTVQLVDVTVTKKDCYEFGFDKLERWIDMCDRCGVKYFEMSHLFTQWGAMHAPKVVANINGKEKKIFGWSTWASGKKYTGFLRAFAAELVKFIDEHNIRERCIFHVSDEPSIRDLKSYKARATLMEEIFPGFKIVDALSDYNFFEKGILKNPISADDHIDKFIGNVPELWTYYCCGQHTNYVSNRFFSMPSQRNRILGYQMYKFDVKGFLQWGCNFWYSRLSFHEIDPFTVADADNSFPAGDPFVIYPGENGMPLVSLRFKVFRDGLQDMRALQLLESLIGREKTVALLESDVSEPLTFSSYPRSDEWHLGKRERINAAIKKAVENT